MVAPSLIVSGVDEKPIITRSTLIDGFTEKDFQVHAINLVWLYVVTHISKIY